MQFRGETYHTVQREMLEKAADLSRYSAPKAVIRVIRALPEVTTIMVHGSWQGMGETPVGDNDCVLEEHGGLYFMTIRYATTTGKPITNCATCGSLVVQGGECTYQADHERDRA